MARLLGLTRCWSFLGLIGKSARELVSKAETPFSPFLLCTAVENLSTLKSYWKLNLVFLVAVNVKIVYGFVLGWMMSKAEYVGRMRACFGRYVSSI